jgi:DnaK suppressor protein
VTDSPAGEFRDRLGADRDATRQRLAALERDFAGIIESAGQANTDDEHDPEGATLAFERQHLAALIAQARDQLAAIDAALARLDGDQFGHCERCGQPIGAGRLSARPTATTCIKCAASTGRTRPG